MIRKSLSKMSEIRETPQKNHQQRANEISPVEKLKQFMEEQKIKEREQFFKDVPYFLAYLIVGFALVICIMMSFKSSYSQFEKQRKEIELKSEECLYSYDIKQCKSAMPSPECLELMSCIKKKPEQMTIQRVVIQAIARTLTTINKDFYGISTLVIALILLRMLQMNKEENKKD